MNPHQGWENSGRNSERDLQLELLLLCMQSAPDPAKNIRIQELIDSTPDWKQLLQLAACHHVLPQIYQRLQSGGLDRVPPEVQQKLRDYSEYNTIRNHYLLSELQRFLSLLDARGIPAIPYKGPLLAQRLHENFAVRHTGDLDIIVPVSAYQQAKALLQSEGFECASTTEAEEARILRDFNEMLLRRQQDQVVVEIHWAVTPRYFDFPFEEMKLWERAVQMEICGQKVLLPPPEDELLMLCVHGTQHAWAKLIAIFS